MIWIFSFFIWPIFKMPYNRNWDFLISNFIVNYFFYPFLGEWVACSVGANFTPHIITVNSGEVSVRNICYLLCSFAMQNNNISHIHGQGVAKIIGGIIYLTFFLVGNKTSSKNNNCICYFYFSFPPSNVSSVVFLCPHSLWSLTYVTCIPIAIQSDNYTKDERLVIKRMRMWKIILNNLLVSRMIMFIFFFTVITGKCLLWWLTSNNYFLFGYIRMLLWR